MGEEYINNNIYNPSAEILKNCTSFSYLEPDVQDAYNKAWESVRLASKDGQKSNTSWIIFGIVGAVAVVAIVAFVLYKKKMNKIKYE